MILHYNGPDSYLFVNGIEQFEFTAKDSGIVANPLCLRNISKDWGDTKQDYLGTCVVLVLILTLLTWFIL